MILVEGFIIMDAKVYVKRTFHSVGQGAFFTEQFYGDDTETLLYNVVYDCGSKSKGIKTQMKRSIRNVFHDKKKIDVLFLSHFDDDHVNFVETLKNKGHLSGTRIFIPMLAAEEWLEIEPFYSNYKYILSLNDGTKGGTRVIRVKFDEGDAGERTLDNRNDPVVIEGIEGDTIPSGTVLRPKLPVPDAIWCYAPFNVQFNALIAEFQKKLVAEGLEYGKLKDRDYVLDKNNHRKLKKIYRGLGKKPSGGTAINLNSLLVMSYPKESDKCCELGARRMISCRGGLWRDLYPGCYSGSCLYTGDTSANEDFVWKRIEQMINQCLGQDSKLVLLQIPHHGSKKSYDKKLLDSTRFFAGFTNYDPFYHQHIFDDNLIMKFALNHQPLILVTRDYCSKYEEYWGVQ